MASHWSKGSSLAPRLEELLRCPRCGQPVGGAATLACQNGHAYQWIGAVPRLLEDVWGADQIGLVFKTRAGFGKQWRQFADNAYVGRKDLLLHLPAAWDASVFSGLVLDAGCGMGRYTALVAGLGADVIGLDPSEAVLEAARRYPEIPFVQADIAAAPFEAESFDLVYSFGVLHHLPDPAKGLAACFRLVRPGGLLLAWVYAERSGLLRAVRRRTRAIVGRIPAMRAPIAWLAAVMLWLLYVLPGRVRGRPSQRLAFYMDKGLRQLHVDCYDALHAPTEVYLSANDCRQVLGGLHASASGIERRRDGSGWLLWAKR